MSWVYRPIGEREGSGRIASIKKTLERRTLDLQQQGSIMDGKAPQWTNLEDEVHSDVLDCGMKYYIRSNKKPANRATIKLVIKVMVV
jgi:hypothetical protein